MQTVHYTTYIDAFLRITAIPLSNDICIILDLVDSLVKPILVYTSDFGGCLKLPKNNPIENMQMAMFKQILGVQKQTTNCVVLLEIGRIPLHIWVAKLSVKN